MDLQERLKTIFPDATRGIQAEVARACDRRQPSVHAWFNGPTAKLERKDAEIICARWAPLVNPRWLADGLGPRLVAGIGATSMEESKPGGAYAAQAVAGRAVPLISWVAAGSWNSVADPYAPGVADDWLFSPVRCSAQTYALRVRGLSMFNPGGDMSFGDGEIIFVDPHVEARHKSPVVVRLDDEDEATFKRLLVEGNTRMLEALNPSWPNRIIQISGRATLSGVVIAQTRLLTE